MGAALSGAALEGVAVAPFPAAVRTSDLVIRPPRAVPWTRVRSIPSAAATRLATGEALPPSPSAGCGAVAVGAAAGAAASGAAAPPAPPPADILPITCPTVT